MASSITCSRFFCVCVQMFAHGLSSNAQTYRTEMHEIDHIRTKRCHIRTKRYNFFEIQYRYTGSPRLHANYISDEIRLFSSRLSHKA